MNKFFEFKGESPVAWFLERCHRIDNALTLIYKYSKKQLFVGLGYALYYIFKTRNAIVRKQFRFRWWLSMKIQGYKFVTMKQFIEEFPPDANCKKCNGKGFGIVQVPTGEKRIMYCKCVHEPYTTSGKRYEISGIE